MKKNIWNLLNRFNFLPQKEIAVAFTALIFSIVTVRIFNIVEIYENSLLENTQLIVLMIAFFFCFSVKKNKVLFRVIAIVLFLMFMREISYGRAIFAMIPEEGPNAMHPWRDYKYGWIANYVVGLYIALGSIYAIINKVWIDAIFVLKKVKIPFFEIFCCCLCVLLQIISETSLHSTVIEETAELVLYSLILALILIYKKALK